MKPTRCRCLVLTTVAALLLLPGLQNDALAGGWTLSRGTTWLRTGFMVQITDERYFIDGSRIPYFFEGHNQTLAAFVDLRHGITDRLEAAVQLPFFGISFDDLAAERNTTGIGDLRMGLRYNLLPGPVVATVGATVKFPTGEFVNDAEIVPVGEGQYDFEVTAEVARSLWPRPGYVTALIGYRWRTPNAETGIHHGDEVLWSFEAGYGVIPRVMLKALIRGLHGLETTSFGLALPSLERRVVYFEPGVLLELSPRRTLEVSVPMSLSGQNWPAGPVFNIGVFQSF